MMRPKIETAYLVVDIIDIRMAYALKDFLFKGLNYQIHNLNLQAQIMKLSYVIRQRKGYVRYSMPMIHFLAIRRGVVGAPKIPGTRNYNG